MNKISAYQAQFTIGDIAFSCSAFKEQIVRRVMDDFPNFMYIRNGEISVNWSPYIVASYEDLENLDLTMWAAGILVDRDEKGSIGIYEAGTSCFCGPHFHDIRLYFRERYLALACDFKQRIIPRIAALEYDNMAKVCGLDVVRQRLPDFEIRQCVEPAVYRTVEV